MDIIIYEWMDAYVIMNRTMSLGPGFRKLGWNDIVTEFYFNKANPFCLCYLVKYRV